MKIGGKLKEEFLDNDHNLSLSLRYGGNCKSGNKPGQNDLKPNFRSTRLLTLCLFVILLCFVTFRPELKEYTPNNKNTCNVYYNKIPNHTM